MNHQHSRIASQKQPRSPSDSSNEEINGFMALKRLKETENHIQMMRRRFKVLKVKDEEARSKTIQHQNKIHMHDDIQRQRREDRKTIDKANQRLVVQVDHYKQKNKKLKEQIEAKIKTAREAITHEKKEENKVRRKQHFENEQKYEKIKIMDKEEKKQKRDKVVEVQKVQKERIERYKESRIVQTLASKSNDAHFLVLKNNEKEKQLAELAKMEEQLAKRSSESIRISQAMKSRMKAVLDQNSRTAKLPEIRNKTHSRVGTNTSTQF